jgi:cell division protein YceG involved in septum cleavage
LDTIQAVLKPKKNNYWYYLHDTKWNIHFAKNNYEHIQNKNNFLR